MSKESLENLSSLMDGEFSRETGLFLTRRLSSDKTMCETWERYHLIRDCIRQPGSKHFIIGLSAKVGNSMDEKDAASMGEEHIPSVPGWRTNRWLKPVSGVAIAASVALMAIIVTGPQSVVPIEGDTSTLTAVNQPFVSPNNLSIAPVSQPVSYSSAQKANTNRLNAYLLRHNQMAKTAGRQGFVSFVPIVATTASTTTETPEDKSVPKQPRSEPEAATDK